MTLPQDGLCFDAGLAAWQLKCPHEWPLEHATSGPATINTSTINRQMAMKRKYMHLDTCFYGEPCLDMGECVRRVRNNELAHRTLWLPVWLQPPKRVTATASRSRSRSRSWWSQLQRRGCESCWIHPQCWMWWPWQRVHCQRDKPADFTPFSNEKEAIWNHAEN